MIGENASSLCYIPGRTHFGIDDDKERIRSFLVALLGLVRSKGLKSFGPVCNSLNSLTTGVQLSGYMTHHSEGGTDVTIANLMTVAGVRNPALLNFPDTGLYGDRGYNDEDYYALCECVNMDTTNTVKRGTTRSQRVIAEHGPMCSLGATRRLGSKTLYFMVYRNGTGRVTFLQTTNALHSHEKLEYISRPEERAYSALFQQRSQEHQPFIGPLTLKEQALRSRGLLQESKTQGPPCWMILREFRYSSTTTYWCLPKSRAGLSQVVIDLLDRDLGLQLSKPEDALPVDLTHKDKTIAQLKGSMTQEGLKAVCKSYGRPASGTKDQLAERIQLGPKERLDLTSFETYLKSTFLEPLPDKDRSAHKLGSLNESKVRNALGVILEKGFGLILDHLWEFGLISREDLEWIVTSVDAWIVVRKQHDATHQEHVVVEIKTVTGDEIRIRIQQLREEYGEYIECQCGSVEFLELVFTKRHRCQVIHHAVSCKLKKVLFVVVSEYKVNYSVLITFSDVQLANYEKIVTDLYNRDLRWAYTTAWDDKANPEQHIPEFREEAVSRPSFSIDRDTVLFHYGLWRTLRKHVKHTKLPLPIAKRIVPAVVSSWNLCKGRIDEMSRYLAGMQFFYGKMTPKQYLTIREIQKVALNAFLIKKQCYHSFGDDTFDGKTLSQILKALAKCERGLTAFVVELAESYHILAPVPGAVPPSPQKRSWEEALGSDGGDGGDNNLERASHWQQTAAALCAKVHRNKLERFRDDPILNRIRLDTTLNHELVKNDDPKSRPHCNLCASGRDGFWCTQYYCPTCNVYLCIEKHGHQHSCNWRFHNIHDPKNLKPLEGEKRRQPKTDQSDQMETGE